MPVYKYTFPVYICGTYIKSLPLYVKIEGDLNITRDYVFDPNPEVVDILDRKTKALAKSIELTHELRPDSVDIQWDMPLELESNDEILDYTHDYELIIE